jgi:hypothetical protein
MEFFLLLTQFIIFTKNKNFIFAFFINIPLLKTFKNTFILLFKLI